MLLLRLYFNYICLLAFLARDPLIYCFSWIHALCFHHFFISCIYVFVCAYIFLNKTCYIHIILLVCLPSRLTIWHRTINWCALPLLPTWLSSLMFFVVGCGLVTFLHLFGNGPWCPCLVHICLAMLLRHYAYSFWCFIESKVPGPLLPFLQYFWALDVGVLYIYMYPLELGSRSLYIVWRNLPAHFCVIC